MLFRVELSVPQCVEELSLISWNLKGGSPPEFYRGVDVGCRQVINQEGDHFWPTRTEQHAKTSPGPGLSLPDAAPMAMAMGEITEQYV